MTDWDPIAEWWRGEVAGDPSHREDVQPLLMRLLEGTEGPLLDLGCGEGSLTALVRQRLGVTTFGCDLSMALLRDAARAVPVVRCELPDLGWVRSGTLGGAYAVYLLDLLSDGDMFFSETARTVRPGGTLVVIVNHPAYTAPDSGPFLDQDGEVMWRWGRYFDAGPSPTLAGGVPLTMHHRPLGELLGAAATHGWALEAMEERGLSAAAIAREPGYAGQESIPRLLGARWTRRPAAAVDPAGTPTGGPTGPAR